MSVKVRASDTTQSHVKAWCPRGVTGPTCSAQRVTMTCAVGAGCAHAPATPVGWRTVCHQGLPKVTSVSLPDRFITQLHLAMVVPSASPLHHSKRSTLLLQQRAAKWRRPAPQGPAGPDTVPRAHSSRARRRRRGRRCPPRPPWLRWRPGAAPPQHRSLQSTGGHVSL